MVKYMLMSPCAARFPGLVRRGRIAGLLLPVLAAATMAAALDPATDITQYTIDFWQDSAGLPQNNVKALLQSRNGYVWVGTKGGLARFDGSRFRVYDDRTPDQLKEAEVWNLVEGDDDSLWIGTFGGGLTRMSGGRFTTFTTKDGLPSDFVTSLARCPDGSLWAGTDDGGVAQWKAGKFTAFGKDDGLQHNRVRAVHCDAKNVLWIGNAKGLSSLDGGRLANFSLGFQGDERITSITEDGQGGLWLASSGQGLMRFHGGEFTRYGEKEGMPHRFVNAVTVDSAGTLWIGSTDGLCRYRDERFSCYYSKVSTLAKQRTLQSVSLAHIQALIEDREGNIWVGTANEGLSRLKDSQFLNYGADDGLVSDESHVVMGTRDGAIWVGTVVGLTRMKDGATTIFDTKDGLSNAAIRALYEDPLDGTLWIGTTVGLNAYRDGRIRTVTEAGLDKMYVFAVHRDRRGDLWIATNGDGLLHQHQGAWKRYTTADGLGSNQLRGMREDANGDIWVGTKGAGLNRWSNGTITSVTTQDGLTSGAVQAVYLDAEGGIWAATRQALSRIKDGKVSNYTTQDGLPSNLVYQQIEDDEGGMWIACSRGLYRIPKEELVRLTGGKGPITPVAYGPETGLRSAAFSVSPQPMMYKDIQGRVWFACLKALSVFDPRRQPTKNWDFPVRVEEITVDQQTVEGREGVEFPPGTGNVEVHYTALHFFAPEKMEFRYRLSGYDSDWVEAGTRRAAYYTGLGPGQYRFRVQSRGLDGVWRDGTPVTFNLSPHFYQTGIFHALLAGVVLAGLRGLFVLRVRRLERLNRELEAKVADRTASLEEEIAERKKTQHLLERSNRDLEDFTAMVSHDLQEPLRKIQAFGERLKAKAGASLGDEANDYLGRVLNAAGRMQSLITDLLTLSRVATRAQPFARVDLDEIVRHVLSDLEVRIEQTGGKVEMQKLPVIDAEPTQMRQLFQNLIGNALKFNRPGQPPVVTITAAETNHTPGGAWELTVRDNGIGFDDQYAEQIFKVFHRLHSRTDYEGTGVGLAVCRKIVERHGGSILAKSRPDEGAAFVITLPVRHSGD